MHRFLFFLILCCDYFHVNGQLFFAGNGLIDIDGNQYPSVVCNGIEWSAINLNVSHFKNGEIITEAKSKSEWYNAGLNKIPAWCYYNNDPANAKLGKLYNWYAIVDPRGLAPDGWHIPSDQEWTSSTNYFSGNFYPTITSFIDFADEIYSKNNNNGAINIKSNIGWKNNMNGNLAGGFNALPAGSRYQGGKFVNIESHTGWWSTTPYGNYDAWGRFLNSKKAHSGAFYYSQSTGLSVRCVKNK
jgi:uncharacterized protein (TIGR02145 family)